MRPLRALGIYIVAVFIGGALLAPWLYDLGQSLAPVFPHVAQSPFHRFVNRAILGLALVGLWPLLRTLRLCSWKEVGLVQPKGQLSKLAAGFALGFISLALVALLARAAGAREFNHGMLVGRLMQKLGGIVLTAVFVAVLEEILFRGALFGALRQSLHWVTALAISSVVYALVHFLESARQSGPVLWYSGLQLLPHMMRGLGNWHELVPGVLNLTLAGALLALAYQRTGNLYFSIGLHAGWIFWLKSYGLLTRAGSGANPWIWGGTKLIDGWLALPILAGTMVLFQRLSLARQRAELKSDAAATR